MRFVIALILVLAAVACMGGGVWLLRPHRYAEPLDALYVPPGYQGRHRN